MPPNSKVRPWSVLECRSWSVQKTDLDTKVVIKGEERYVFNYKKSKNVTIIKERTGNGIIRTTRQGFVAVTITTNGDEVSVDY